MVGVSSDASKQLLNQLLLVSKEERRLGRSLEQSTGIMAAMTELPQVYSDIDNLMQIKDQVRLVQQLRAEELEGKTIELLRSMAAVQTNVLAGLLLNVLLAIALVVGFSSSVQTRLLILLANVRALNNDQYVDKAVGGDDEIALVVEAVRAAKADIRRAADQRRFVITRIADNILSPLLVASTALEDIDEEVAAGIEPHIREKLDSAVKSISRVRNLVNDFIASDRPSSQPPNLNRHNYQLGEIVAESFDCVRSLGEQKNIKLLDSTNGVCANVDKERMVQVLTNLLSNAIKFSPKDSEVWVLSESSDTAVIISVKDEGPGIDSEAARHVFDKYFQTDTEKKSQGFGLGLAIVKQIVEAHGGTISVISAPGCGCTFSIALPKEEVAVA
jgi:two-component system sensor histidine kinase BaeS